MELQARGVSLHNRLNGVNVTMHTGEVTAIVGPNGAGKSSLLSCLAGLIEPTSGSVWLGGQPLTHLTPRTKAQCIGFLPQSPEIAWEVTVETLVALGRLPWQAAPFHRARSNKAEDAAAVEAALGTMDLQALRSRQVSRLSGGERARALAARVLAGKPSWILADEPLANLDLAHAAALVRLLRSEAQSGVGVVVVVHDLATAMNHADQVIVLNQGSVVVNGSPEDALSAELVSEVWQIEAQWLGPPRAHALTIEERPKN